MRLNVIECMRNGCWRSVHNIVLFCKMCAIAYCTYCIMALNNKLSSRACCLLFFLLESINNSKMMCAKYWLSASRRLAQEQCG